MRDRKYRSFSLKKLFTSRAHKNLLYKWGGAYTSGLPIYSIILAQYTSIPKIPVILDWGVIRRGEGKIEAEDVINFHVLLKKY
jgi:hypothetical protein